MILDGSVRADLMPCIEELSGHCGAMDGASVGLLPQVHRLVAEVNCSHPVRHATVGGGPLQDLKHVCGIYYLILLDKHILADLVDF